MCPELGVTQRYWSFVNCDPLFVIFLWIQLKGTRFKSVRRILCLKLLPTHCNGWARKIARLPASSARRSESPSQSLANQQITNNQSQMINDFSGCAVLSATNTRRGHQTSVDEAASDYPGRLMCYLRLLGASERKERNTSQPGWERLFAEGNEPGRPELRVSFSNSLLHLSAAFGQDTALFLQQAFEPLDRFLQFASSSEKAWQLCIRGHRTKPNRIVDSG